MKKAAIVVLLLLAVSGRAVAGPYSDALGRKMVGETTPNEKLLYVRWCFMVCSNHPSLKGLSVISEKQRDETYRSTAAMFTRLLTQSCISEARDVLLHEGTDGFGQAFSVFGNFTGNEVLGGREIQGALNGALNFLDGKLIEAKLLPAGINASYVEKPTRSPVVREQKRPTYPPRMRAYYVQAEVVVDFFVTSEGKVVGARMVRAATRPALQAEAQMEAHLEFGAAAAEAVAQWQFDPGLSNGNPVATHMQVPVVFTLNNEMVK